MSEWLLQWQNLQYQRRELEEFLDKHFNKNEKENLGPKTEN